MAEQTGIIRLRGKLGSLSFYRLGGRDVARVAYGPGKEELMTDPKYVRTRENIAEFGGASRVGSAIRQAFPGLLLRYCDKDFYRRLVGLAKLLCANCDGEKGRRPFLLSANAGMLAGTELNTENPFRNAFQGKVLIAPGSRLVVVVPSFVPAEAVKAPRGADHFRFVFGFGVVSDFVYCEVTRRYQPVVSGRTGVVHVYTGDPVVVNGTCPVDLSVVLSEAGFGGLAPGTTGFLVVGVEFLQRVGVGWYSVGGGSGVIRKE